LFESAIYPVHLCQPDSQKSCGACCGLYNYQDHSRKTLQILLERRTTLFHSLKNTLSLEEYLQKAESLVESRKLFEVIHNCHYLGFLDLEQKKVGCLLHPVLHQGDDLRRHSFYGTEVCAGHFCPSYSCLDSLEQQAVVSVLDDWYLYGLVIADIDLVKEFFHHTQTRLGDSLRLERLKTGRVKDAMKDFFKLKENWPYAAGESRFGKYYFSDSEYQIARIEYEKNWGIKPSTFNKILVSLSSEFPGLEEVRKGEAIIEETIQQFIRAYREG